MSKKRIETVIREFHFWNYGMDEVSNALDEDPEAQEWVPALAEAIYDAINKVFVCAHCGGQVRDNWASVGTQYWHLSIPECRWWAVTAIGGEPDGSQTQDQQGPEDQEQAKAQG